MAKCDVFVPLWIIIKTLELNTYLSFWWWFVYKMKRNVKALKKFPFLACSIEEINKITYHVNIRILTAV